MILSPYHNPPYRAPTPRGSATPPPPVGHSLESASGADSPRSRVAKRLQSLDIGQAFEAQKDDRPHKRQKRDPHVHSDAIKHELHEDLVSQDSSPLYLASSRSTDAPQMGETPDGPASRIPLSPPQSPRRVRTSSNISDLSATDGIRGKKAKGPPPDVRPPRPTAPSLPSNSRAPERPSSPAAVDREDMRIDQVALTWQTHEITGHTIDAGSPDDDGEGINGIGFKPTPAIAYARSQKREQQVREWRLREVREARQWRLERRRSGAAAKPESSRPSRRKVKFEDVG